jgi:hypothetical protein
MVPMILQAVEGVENFSPGNGRHAVATKQAIG